MEWLVIPLRAASNDELEGLDLTQHGEEAYSHAEGSAAMASSHGTAGAALPRLQAVTE